MNKFIRKLIGFLAILGALAPAASFVGVETASANPSGGYCLMPGYNTTQMCLDTQTNVVRYYSSGTLVRTDQLTRCGSIAWPAANVAASSMVNYGFWAEGASANSSGGFLAIKFSYTPGSCGSISSNGLRASSQSAVDWYKYWAQAGGMLLSI